MSNKDKHPEKEEPTKQEEIENQESPNTEAAEPEAEATEADKVQEMGEKLAELNDKYLRLYSEYENYRKRTNMEKADLLLNGSREMMKAILPVIDDFERALKNMKNADDVNAVLEGVELIYKKFIDILAKQGVSIIETKEADFDVDVHEAVAQLPAPTPELKGKVMDCTLTGYKLNEKVIRHAQVVVGV